MRAHTSSRSRSRQTKKEVAVLADEESLELIKEVLKGEDHLKNIAGHLWRNEPLLPWGLLNSEEPAPASAVQYSKNFILKRTSGDNWLKVDDNWYRQFGAEYLWRIGVAKTRADIRQRMRAAAKHDG